MARNLLALNPWVSPNREGTYNSIGPSGNLLADEFANVADMTIAAGVPARALRRRGETKPT